MFRRKSPPLLRRGHALDYERWAQEIGEGGDAWSYRCGVVEDDQSICKDLFIVKLCEVVWPMAMWRKWVWTMPQCEEWLMTCEWCVMTCARGVCRFYCEQYQTLSFHEYQEGVGWTEFWVDLVSQLTKFVTCRNILPYYRKAQSHQEGESTYRGGGGFWCLGRFWLVSGRFGTPGWPQFLAQKFSKNDWIDGAFHRLLQNLQNVSIFQKLDPEDLLSVLVSLEGPIRSSLKPHASTIGGSGPLTVTRRRTPAVEAINEAFVHAGEQAGEAETHGMRKDMMCHGATDKTPNSSI